MLITLQIGDPSQDGHGVYQTYAIESNLSTADITDAYATFFETYPTIAHYDDFCSGHDDCAIDSEFYDFLVKLGLALTLDTIEEDSVDSGYLVDPEDFLELYLFCVKHIRSDFQYSYVDIPNIHVGGYGCVDLD